MPPDHRITTLTGLDAAFLTERIGGRQTLIWGMGSRAEEVVCVLKRASLLCHGWIHTTAPAATYWDIPVWDAACLDRLDPRDHFVIYAGSVGFWSLASQHLKTQGFLSSQDYLQAYTLTRLIAQIEVVNKPLRPLPEIFAPFDPGLNLTVHLPLDKVDRIVTALKGVPSLSRIIIGIAGEPLAHPQCVSILKVMSTVASVSLQTSLTHIAAQDWPAALAIRQLRWMISPPPDDHPTAMEFLAQWPVLVNHYNHMPAEDRHRIAIHIANSGNFARVRRMANEAGLKVLAHLPFPFPYSRLLGESGYVSYRWLDADVFARMREEQAGVCRAQRVFPVISATGELVNCHLWQAEKLDDQWLDKSFQEYVIMRNTSVQCRRCLKAGLHRLDEHLDLNPNAN